MTTALEYTLLDKQHRFVAEATSPNPTFREVLSSGAFGSGKSRALCVALIARASVKGTREALVRKTRVSLVATTLKSLLHSDGDMPPVLPVGSYDHNKTEGTIRIRGGGEIVYLGLDNVEKIGSLNLSGVAVDQVEELTETEYIMLQGRTRLRVTGVPNRVYSVANPKNPAHFLCDRFNLSVGSGFGVTRDTTLYGSRLALHTRTEENTHLPASYIESLRAYPDLARKRYFEGLWVGSDGLVYDKFSSDRHARIHAGELSRFILCIDDGYTNPFAVLKLGEHSGDRLHVAGEWYERGCSMARKLAMVEAAGGREAEAIIVDPSAAQLIAELRNRGFHVSPANNDVFEGIVRVQSRLEDKGGEPGLTIDPGCANALQEIQTYEWAKNKHGSKDAPVKAFDHAMDALRYGVSYFDFGLPSALAIVDARQTTGTGAGAARLTPRQRFAATRRRDDW